MKLDSLNKPLWKWKNFFSFFCLLCHCLLQVKIAISLINLLLAEVFGSKCNCPGHIHLHICLHIYSTLLPLTRSEFRERRWPQYLSVFFFIFLRGSGCCGRIRRLEIQHSEIGQQALKDKTCLKQTKVRICWVGTSPDHFDLLALSSRGYKNLPHIFRCLSRNQSPVRCGGLLLRTAPAILRLITWQPLWGPRDSASPAGFLTLYKSLTAYTCCRLCALMNNMENVLSYSKSDFCKGQSYD